MAFTPYLSPEEYADFGVPDATAAQVNRATRAVDAYLGRPEGLVWTPDAGGMPAYMANASPTMGLKGSAVSPGADVTLTISNARFGYQDVGTVVVLDRADPDSCESCVVTAASGNTLTLANVQFAHAAPTIEFGLTILEEMPGRVRLSRSPVVAVLAAFGRYGYGRYMRQLSGCPDDYEALLVTNYGQVSASGWSRLDLSTWDVNYATGAVRMPRDCGDSSRIHYLAGWTQATLPGAIKQAVANMAAAMGDADRPSGNVKLLKAGDATIEWFGAGSLDADTRSLLQPFRTVRL
ncbi:MAG: hypothetical protein U0835_00185 [Isosphaeraceae bacterium]